MAPIVCRKKMRSSQGRALSLMRPRFNAHAIFILRSQQKAEMCVMIEKI